jgi:hypothetical protein
MNPPDSSARQAHANCISAEQAFAKPDDRPWQVSFMNVSKQTGKGT